jgi:hypothetical protein
MDYRCYYWVYVSMHACIGEIVGAGFLAAGAIQKGIQNKSLYVGDIKKTFESTLKEVCSTKHNLRI